MKYFTAIPESPFDMLINAKNPIFQKESFAFIYPKYNYLPIFAASHFRHAIREHISPFFRASTSHRIVHNLCINWQ